jgi:transaldolase
MSYPRIFIDTAHLEELREAVSTGIIDGIATNPEKLAATGQGYREVVSAIREFYSGPIAVQSMGKTAAEIVSHALVLHNMDSNLAVKVTCSIEGIKAIGELVQQGVRTNCTLIYTPAQGLAAGLARSTFISPFVGRSEMADYDGIELIRKIVPSSEDPKWLTMMVLNSFERSGGCMIPMGSIHASLRPVLKTYGR